MTMSVDLCHKRNPDGTLSSADISNCIEHGAKPCKENIQTFTCDDPNSQVVEIKEDGTSKHYCCSNNDVAKSIDGNLVCVGNTVSAKRGTNDPFEGILGRVKVFNQDMAKLKGQYKYNAAMEFGDHLSKEMDKVKLSHTKIHSTESSKSAYASLHKECEKTDMKMLCAGKDFNGAFEELAKFK